MNRRPALAPALLIALSLSTATAAQARDGGRDSDHGSDRGSGHGSDHGSGHDSSDRGGGSGRHGGRDGSRDSRDGDAGGSDSDDDSGRDLLRRDAATRSASLSIDVDRGVDGHERRQGEVLMVGSDAAVAAVRAAGYGVIVEHRLGAFDEMIARVRLAPGESVERAISRIHARAPEASAAANHLFRPSASGADGATAALPAVGAGHDASARLGIIDTGADRQWPLLAAAVVDAQSFTGTAYAPREHGSLVAAIGSAGGARLGVADVFDSDAEHQLVAPADAIARAVDWLISEHYPVINISVEGPDNEVLAHVVRRALAANVVLVAAAGNGGPAAAAAYPAAYPGVIAVTAVDEQGRVYRRANRGGYIAFAATGVRVENRYSRASTATVSGTSFAAPRVAAEIAQRLALPSRPEVQDVLRQLQSQARDLGEAGRDPVYGWGWLR